MRLLSLLVQALWTLAMVLPTAVGQAPAADDATTSCNTCAASAQASWWHGVGLNCPAGPNGNCDVCEAVNGNAAEVVAACSKASSPEECCTLCTQWNEGLLPGGIKPGNDRPCRVWYFRKEGSGGWCGLKDCAGPGHCGAAANGAEMVAGPACGTRGWGWGFVAAVLGAASLYAGAGVLLSWRAGEPLRFPGSLPHLSIWLNIAALVQDGTAFAASGGRRRSSPGRGAASGLERPLRAGGEEKSPRKERRGKPPREKEKKSKRRRSGGDEGRGLAEGTSTSSAAAAAAGGAEAGRGGGGGEPGGQRSAASGGGGRWVHVAQ